MTNNKLYSSKQERLVANYLDWEVVSGSGARFQPGDVISETWLGECKTHSRPGFRIEFIGKVWNKIYMESVSQMKRPAYFVDDGSQRVNHTWVMTRWLPLDTVKVVEYPGSVNESFAFDGTTMYNELTRVFDLKDDAVVFELKFHDDTVWVTNLEMFKKIVELI